MIYLLFRTNILLQKLQVKSEKVKLMNLQKQADCLGQPAYLVQKQVTVNLFTRAMVMVVFVVVFWL